MAKRRIHSRKPVRKGILSDMVRRTDLKKISEGKELRGEVMCYHINERHPNIISQFNISAIHDTAKMGIIKWIKEGKIYIRK